MVFFIMRAPLNGVRQACSGSRSADVDPDRVCVPEDGGAGTFADCCGGHFGSSKMVADYATGATVGPSNAAVVAALDPRAAPDFSYPLYHHFRWDHCDQPFLD